MKSYKEVFSEDKFIFSTVTIEKRFVFRATKYIEKVLVSLGSEKVSLRQDLESFLEIKYGLKFKNNIFVDQLISLSPFEGRRIYDSEGRLVFKDIRDQPRIPLVSRLDGSEISKSLEYVLKEDLISELHKEFSLDSETAADLLEVKPFAFWFDQSIELFFYLLCCIRYPTRNRISSFPPSVAELMSDEGIQYAVYGECTLVPTRSEFECSFPHLGKFIISGSLIDSHKFIVESMGIEIRYSNIKLGGGAGIKSNNNLIGNLVGNIVCPTIFDFTDLTIGPDVP